MVGKKYHGTCNLCHQDKQLCKSHIIPEFLYTNLYDNAHKFHILSTEKRRKKYKYTGIWERVLCADCENKISVFENYSQQIFSGSIPIESSREGDIVKIKGLDYKKFKLFGVSILWRAGVSTNIFFSKVNLGRHLEQLRAMLMAENPGKPCEYSFFISPLIAGENDIFDLIVQPTRSRLDGSLCYRFVFGGMVWVYLVTNHAPPKLFKETLLNEEGRMTMLVSELKDVPFIVDNIKNMIH